MGERVPPKTVMSPSAKPVGASVKVKVMVAVSPALRELLSLVIDRVGAWVSKVSDGVVPAPPLLPAASV